MIYFKSAERNSPEVKTVIRSNNIFEIFFQFFIWWSWRVKNYTIEWKYAKWNKVKNEKEYQILLPTVILNRVLHVARITSKKKKSY